MNKNIGKTFGRSSSIEICSPEKAEELRLFLKRERENNPDDVDAMIAPVYDSIEYSEGVMDVLYNVLAWESNRVGLLHGGITGAMMDHAAASVIFVFLGYWCPTVDMSIKFLRQMRVGDKLCCRAKLLQIGKRFITASAEMYDAETDTLTATALFTYANGASNISSAK